MITIGGLFAYALVGMVVAYGLVWDFSRSEREESARLVARMWVVVVCVWPVLVLVFIWALGAGIFERVTRK